MTCHGRAQGCGGEPSRSRRAGRSRPARPARHSKPVVPTSQPALAPGPASSELRDTRHLECAQEREQRRVDILGPLLLGPVPRARARPSGSGRCRAGGGSALRVPRKLRTIAITGDTERRRLHPGAGPWRHELPGPIDHPVPVQGAGEARPRAQAVPVLAAHEHDREPGDRVRAVPGSIVRWGAYVAPGAVLMPSFVNLAPRRCGSHSQPESPVRRTRDERIRDDGRQAADPVAEAGRPAASARGWRDREHVLPAMSASPR